MKLKAGRRAVQEDPRFPRAIERSVRRATSSKAKPRDTFTALPTSRRPTSKSTTASIISVSESGVSIVHDEHEPVTLPAGDYEVVRQREHSLEEIRNVAD